MNEKKNEHKYSKCGTFTETEGGTTYVVILFYRQDTNLSIDDRTKKLIREELKNEQNKL